jgi:hypothetical protein
MMPFSFTLASDNYITSLTQSMVEIDTGDPALPNSRQQPMSTVQDYSERTARKRNAYSKDFDGLEAERLLSLFLASCR